MGRRGFLRVMLRFLALAVLPAAVVLGFLWRASDDAFEEARHRGLVHLGQAAGTLLSEDLARGTTLLVGVAEPWPDADPTDPAVIQALAGDTVRALRPRADGIGVSILLPASDSLTGVVRRADGRLRSAVIERLPSLTGASAAFYLGGRWLAGDSLAPATLPGDWMRAVASAPAATGAPVDSAGLGHAQLFAALGGSVDATALLLLSDDDVERPVRRIARLLTGILLFFSTAVVFLGLAPGRSGRPATRMAGAGVVLLYLVTLGAGGWSITRTQLAEGRFVRQELTRIGALLREYGRADDVTAAQRITGARVLRIDADGAVATSDGSPVPPGAAELPSPPPNFPATGRLAGTDEVYLVLRGEGGRTVLLREDVESTRPMWVAGIGAIVLGLGLFGFLRGPMTPSEREESEEPEESEEDVAG